MSNPFLPERYTGSTVRTSLLWHYTTGLNFMEIVDDGMILPATAFVPPGERPIVWFSANPIWEPTACKGILMPGGLVRSATFTETLTRGRGLARFGVTRGMAPDNFAALVKKSRMSLAAAEELKRGGKKDGADPCDWHGTFRPVVRAQWKAIDIWEEDHWVRILEQ
jgi:hypothetical protein